MPIDIFDQIELSAEDRIIISDEFKRSLADEVKEALAKVPLNQIIEKIVLKKIEESKPKEDLKAGLIEITSKEISKTKKEVKEEISKSSSEIKEDVESLLRSKIEDLKKEQEEFINKMKEKYADLRNSIISSNDHPRYEFGGYPPPGGVLPISFGGTDRWRIVVTGDDAENLSVQRLENGVWVEKGSFQ